MNQSILFIEATSGVSGDMLLGALLGLGVPVEVLNDAWSNLGKDNYEIEVFETERSGMKATQCRVRTDEKQGPKTWKEYESLLKRSGLPEPIRKDALMLCRRLFEKEAEFHGIPLARLHLHEIGGTDLLIDVVGTLAGIRFLDPGLIVASPVNTGRGFVKFSHGRYPIPAPATTSLLVGAPVFQNEVEGELATPTGALLLTHLAGKFGPMPAMTLQKTSAGAGEREIPDHPNVLRMFLGSRGEETAADDEVYLGETNIDDCNPQILAYFMEKAFEKGALDVFFTPIFMKKNRPAIRLSFLARKSLLQEIVDLLFAETTAIGLRYWKVERQTLERRWKEIRIGRTAIRIKESYRDGILFNFQPEFEDCRKAAEKLRRPLKTVLAEAIQLYLRK